MYLKYVGIRVTDLDRSVRFYTELLGLREEKRRDTREWGGGIWVMLKDETSGQRLEVNWYAPGSRHATPYVPGEGLDHLGFVVDDVETTYRDLVAKGAGPTDLSPKDTDGWVAYVTDPDGNWIEIFQLSEPRSASAPA
ncbi:MAG TPA: VOC family protein [Thermoplasmata archaeon]